MKKFPYRYRVLIFLFFLTLITYLDRVTISLVGVRIKSAFHLSNTQFGWVLGAFALAYALFEIPSSIWGDRIGQRAIFIRIVLWWSLFTALTGLTTGLASLVVVRFLFGMGESGAYPNSSGVVSRWFPALETTRSISWLNVGANTGAAVAPLIVIPLAAVYGWRVPFFVNASLGVIWVVVCFYWFRDHPHQMKHIPLAEKEKIEKTRRFIEHQQPFLWRSALKNTSIWALALSFFCSQWANYFFIAWMPVYLQEGRHFSEHDAKTATSYLFLVGIVGAVCSGIFSDWLVKKMKVKFARKFMAISSFTIMASLILAAALTTNNTILTGCLITAHLFYAPNVITCFSTCVDIGAKYAASVAGFMNFFGQMGAFTLAVIFGKIVDTTHNFNAPLFVMVIVLAIGALLWLAIHPDRQVSNLADARQ